MVLYSIRLERDVPFNPGTFRIRQGLFEQLKRAGGIGSVINDTQLIITGKQDNFAVAA